MQTAEVVELIIAGAAICFLGLIVLSRDWHQNALRWFFAMCMAVSLWSWGIALFVLSQTIFGMLFWANFYYVSAFGIAAASQMFTSYWLHSRRKSLYMALSAVSMLLVVVVLIIEPHFIISDLAVTGGSKMVVLNPPGYGLYSLLFVLLFGLAMVRLGVAGSSLEPGLHRSQTRYITISLIFAGLFGAFFNLFLPWLNNYSAVWIGPFSAVIFVAFVSYAIVRQKLFDIRSFVIRAVTYLFSTVLLSIVFIVPAVLIVAAIIHVQFTWPRFGWGVMVATVFALFYNRVRVVFDNLTNRIFFRGYYEPQNIINQLSEALVYSVDAEHIKHQSARILVHAVKTRRLDWWLVGSTDDVSGRLQSLARLFHGRMDANVCIVNELPDKSRQTDYLREQDIAALIRLRAGDTTLGFMALGFKESGEAYTVRDRQLLNIASDEIAIALQNALHFEEIQHFNQTLQERVQKATRELKHTNERLQALDETKDEFITMASHQLRTPLTSVKGYLSMVLEGDAGKLNAQQQKLLTQSYLSAQRMVYLIADLLNLSRLNTGKFVIESTPVNLAEVVQSEIDQLRETAESRGVKLSYTRPEGFPSLMLDETKIRQVVMNFIDNAIYYTPAGGSIDIELDQTSAVVEYRVRDTGIGVPKAEQHKLFTKFYRAGNARRARPDGTGLGLFMAKKVIAAQGGVIIFESEEGKGSTFGFRFSRARHAVPIADSPRTVPTQF